MSISDVRWIAEGGPSESDDDRPDFPIDEVKRRAFDAIWTPALEARVRVTKAAGSRMEAVALLSEAVIGGAMWARGVPSDAGHRRSVQSQLGLPENDDFQAIPIEPSFWAGATDQDKSRWNWMTGEFCSSGSEPGRPAVYFNVEFAGFEVDALCEDNGLTIPAASPQGSQPLLPGKNRGGRSSGKHGEPIAEMAIRLYNMDNEFARYTGEAIAIELAEIYTRLGVAAPSQPNLEDISYGIRRAVKAARQGR